MSDVVKVLLSLKHNELFRMRLQVFHLRVAHPGINYGEDLQQQRAKEVLQETHLQDRLAVIVLNTAQENG